MRKAVIGSFALLAIAALALASSDPWKDKPFQQWDEKDVQRVLSNSPWSRMVQVDANWDGGAEQPSRLPQGSPSSPSGGGSNGGGNRSGMGGGGGAGGGGSTPPSAGGAPTAGAAPQAMFAVRWASSRTMREAFYRGAVLSGGMKEEDAEKQAAQPMEDYEVILAGTHMAPFESAEEAGVKQNTVLITKKGKQKIEPSKVEFQRNPDGKTLRAIIISFPKRTATGEGTIGADEKGAEFTCSVGKVSIKASFDFSKMYDAQGRDL